MIFQHDSLSRGRWGELTLCQQLAHVGSEVERALSWRRRGRPDRAGPALDRALELLYFTIGDPRHRKRLRELTRLREVLLDDFIGNNEFGSTDAAWIAYFNAFAFAARNPLARPAGVDGADPEAAARK